MKRARPGLNVFDTRVPLVSSSLSSRSKKRKMPLLLEHCGFTLRSTTITVGFLSVVSFIVISMVFEIELVSRIMPGILITPPLLFNSVHLWAEARDYKQQYFFPLHDHDNFRLKLACI